MLEDKIFEENTIDLHELFALIWKNALFIILLTFIITLATFLVSKYVIPEQYRSETTIYLKPHQTESGSINYNDIQINQRMVKTYAEIIKSRTVLSRVIEELNQYELSYNSLRDGLSVSSLNDTEIILIVAEFPDPDMAKDVANTIAEVFKEEINNYITIDNLEVLDEAIANKEPVSPRVLLNTVIGFVLGGMISVGIVLLREFLNRTLRTERDVNQHLRIPVLGTVPDIKKL